MKKYLTIKLVSLKKLSYLLLIVRRKSTKVNTIEKYTQYPNIHSGLHPPDITHTPEIESKDKLFKSKFSVIQGLDVIY